MKRNESAMSEIVSPKKKKKSLYSELSQMNNIKETQNLYHSNLFRMQVEELMQEMHISEAKKEALLERCDSLKDFIYSLKESKEYDVADRIWIRNLNTHVPISEKYVVNKGVWKFVPPSEIKIVGSFPLDLTVGRNFEIDMCIEIPKACFKKSDYLNQRYHQKRAFYLAYVAGHLQRSNLVESISYSNSSDDQNSPVIIVKPSGKLAKKYSFRILFSPEASLFQLSRFTPKQNNLRKSWFTGENKADSENTATPLYNSSVLQDLTRFNSHEFMLSNLEGHQKVKEGIILLKIWIHQRGLHKGRGSFNGFIVAMFVIYLLKKRRITSMMSYYQIIRTTWLALASNEWQEFGISLDMENNGPGLESFLNYFEVVFIDPSGYLNLCANMCRETLLRVNQEAKLSLKYLDDTNVNSFENLFIKTVIYEQAFDAILRIHGLDQFENTLNKDQCGNELLDRCGDFDAIAVKKILKTMYQALGPRISSIHVKPIESKMWDIRKDCLSLSHQDDCFTFGLLFNPDRFSEVLDKGPPGNSPMAIEFREFWGAVADLRRFQDGSIHEAVVWPGDSMSEKRNVIYQILIHSLARHVSISPEAISYISNQLDSSISFNQVTLPKNIKAYGTGEEANMAMLQSFDSLCLSLRKLKDLPLVITSIQGISPAFRFSQVYPPLPSRHFDSLLVEPLDLNHMTFQRGKFKVMKYVDALHVLITLESSGKWPDDLEALLYVKASFHLKFAKLLQDQCFLKTLPNAEYVDVYKDGYIFRLSVTCHKEIVLQKTLVSPDGMKVVKDNPKSLELEHQMVALPKLTSSINGIQKQFASFSPAVRIAKRWISCQMLSDFIPELAIELIMVYLYLQPAPYTVTNSPMIAFQRFLYFLSHHNWKGLPVIVNLNDELTFNSCSEIQKNFDNCRSVLSNMFIATPLDKSSNLTKHSPSVQILLRLVLLAKESLKVFSDYMNTNNKEDLMKIFRPSYKVYSALIKLKPGLVSNCHQRFQFKEKVKFSFEPEKTDPMPLTQFDPVQCYLKELKDSFGDIALFFYDNHGGDTIGVLFKPHVFEETDFKIANVNYMKKVGAKMSVNLDAVLSDFEQLGNKLVHHVINNVNMDVKLKNK